MPGHADHEARVVAEVGGPPVLRIRHQGIEVGLQGLVVELLELVSVVERRAQGVGAARVLVQQVQAQLVRPPVLVGRAAAGGGVEGTLGF